MQLKEAKTAYELGAVGALRAVRCPVKAGWSLHIIGRQLGQEWILKTAQGEMRLFASLDTLVGVAESISGCQFGGCDLWGGK